VANNDFFSFLLLFFFYFTFYLSLMTSPKFAAMLQALSADSRASSTTTGPFLLSLGTPVCCLVGRAMYVHLILQMNTPQSVKMPAPNWII
jgi:hypothetical protein